MKPKFILSKSKLLEQVKTLEELGLKVSYSYKTNREVGNVLQEISDVDFSIHAREEIDMIKDKDKIWFFTQAESEEDLIGILEKGIKNFVIDNEVDLDRLLKVVERFSQFSFESQLTHPQTPSAFAKVNSRKYEQNQKQFKINISLRMKFSEHRIGSGKYFVYGMFAEKVNEIISRIKDNKLIDKLGVHIHRKSQNVSEWEIVDELRDSLSEESLKRIDVVNLGGGLPSMYKSYTAKVMPYIFEKLKNAKKFLESYNIETYIEPGRFLAAPCIELITEIIQIYEKKIIINTTIYNGSLDTFMTNTKMLVKGELEDDEDGDYYLIKGSSPTRDDIFRYKVKLKEPRVGDKIVFLNAGAYNYTTDFFGFKKLKTEIEE